MAWLAQRAPLLVALASALAFGGAGGCNLLTGADDIEIGDDDDDDGAGGAGATAGPGGAGTGAAPTTTGAGADNPTTTSGAPTTTTTTTTTGTGGSAPTCDPPCGASQFCEDATFTCQCSPGFVSQGGGCVPAPAGDPTSHTETEVCDAWNDGHVITAPNPHTASGDCDPGTLSQGGLNDTLTRINMYRWLAGLGPVDDDAGLNATDQACANLESWWNFGSGGNPHAPPSSSMCYSPEGASGAGMSNIAWGSGHPANAIDQFMEDWGNETTMGHRRWIMNPPLGPVGIGYWAGGGMYGNAMCLAVFGSSGGGPSPSWTSVPVAGFAPQPMTQWAQWTFQGNLAGLESSTVTMLDVDTNTPIPVTMMPLSGGFGQPTISWVPQGGASVIGKTYRVTVTGVSGGPIVYDVIPVGC